MPSVSEKAADDIQTSRELAARDTAVAGAADVRAAVALATPLLVVAAALVALPVAAVAVVLDADVAVAGGAALAVVAALDAEATLADTVPLTALPTPTLPPQALSRARPASGSTPERTRRRLNRRSAGRDTNSMSDPFLSEKMPRHRPRPEVSFRSRPPRRAPPDHLPIIMERRCPFVNPVDQSLCPVVLRGAPGAPRRSP
jgi:hypothetical protein